MLQHIYRILPKQHTQSRKSTCCFYSKVNRSAIGIHGKFQEHLKIYLTDPVHEGHRLKYEHQIELCFKLQGWPYWFLIFPPNEVTVMSRCWHKITLKVSIRAEIIPGGIPRPCFAILNKFLTRWIYTSKMLTPSSDQSAPTTPFHSFRYFSANLTTPMGGLDYVPSAG